MKIEDNILDEVKALREQLHQMPETALCETKTKACLMTYLTGLADIQIVDRGKWFYACYDGGGTQAPIAFRGDFDAVTGKDGRPGHYCGHDGHAATLAGLARCLSVYKPARKVYMIFQPAEEIGQGALLCKSLLTEKGISEIYGFHNIPGYPLGTVLILSDTFACASTGMEITIEGNPTHAAYPEAGKNPSEVIARLILMKDELLKTFQQRLVLVTVIGAQIGGEAYGVSADKAVLRLTLRAEREVDFKELTEAYAQAAKAMAEADGMDCKIRWIETFPATENHAAQVAKIMQAAEYCGCSWTTPPEPLRWSEDFGYYLQMIPGAFFGIGAGEFCPQLHTEDYIFPDDVSRTALQIYMELLGME